MKNKEELTRWEACQLLEVYTRQRGQMLSEKTITSQLSTLNRSDEYK